jgi:hypothetical protein
VVPQVLEEQQELAERLEPVEPELPEGEAVLPAQEGRLD